MKEKLQIGDVLYRNKGVVVAHAGVYLGNNQVIHNSPENNVQRCSFEQFSEGKTVQVVSSNLDESQAMQLQHKAEKMLSQSKSYNVFNFNCEQMVSELLGGVASSAQLKWGCIGAISAALIARSGNSRHVFAFSTVGLLAGCLLTNTSRTYDFVLKP